MYLHNNIDQITGKAKMYTLGILNLFFIEGELGRVVNLHNGENFNQFTMFYGQHIQNLCLINMLLA